MYFEETGVDALFVDEAHLFKNLEVFTKMNNVAGLGSRGSQRAMDMRMKIQYINEKNQGRASLWQQEPSVKLNGGTLCDAVISTGKAASRKGDLPF